MKRDDGVMKGEAPVCLAAPTKRTFPQLPLKPTGSSGPRRDWNLYIKKQKYSECQLVAAINAWTFLTGRPLRQDSRRYEALVDMCGARHGAAISIEKIHRRLGIEAFNEGVGVVFGYRLPAEISVWHKRYGFHSVLAVEWEPRTMSYRIPNFEWATNQDGWIYAEDLNHFVVRTKMPWTPDGKPDIKAFRDKWAVRSFRLARMKGEAMWDKHLYARVEIPEADAQEIRSALEAVLLGGSVLTDHQKGLLVKLRSRLEDMEPVSHVGPPKW